MLRVGLTGGLGSGKSTAASLFAELGVSVIQADEVGRGLMQPGQPVYAEIVIRFGPEIVCADGSLDRKALAEIAFRGGRLQELNEIVHPPVIAAQEEWMRGIFSADKDAIAMVESALIFEVERAGEVKQGSEVDQAGAVHGWRQRFDRIVLVTAPDERKVERYIQRFFAGREPESGERQSMAEAARLRLAAQVPDGEKAPLSDYVIDNSGPLTQLSRAVSDIYLKLRADANHHGNYNRNATRNT